MSYTNQDIARLATEGKTAHSSTGNFWTENTEGVNYVRYFGWNSDRIVRILRERMPHITQIVGSYDTIVAWKDSGRWVRVDRGYSITTSSRHLSTLYGVSDMFIPNDSGLEEYMAQLEGRTVYERGWGRKLGTYRAA